MQPLIGTYTHHNKEIAAIVVLAMDTDFATRTVEAQEFANRLAMYCVGYKCKSVRQLLGIEELNVKESLREISESFKENVQFLQVVLVDSRESEIFRM